MHCTYYAFSWRDLKIYRIAMDVCGRGGFVCYCKAGVPFKLLEFIFKVIESMLSSFRGLFSDLEDKSFFRLGARQHSILARNILAVVVLCSNTLILAIPGSIHTIVLSDTFPLAIVCEAILNVAVHSNLSNLGHVERK